VVRLNASGRQRQVLTLPHNSAQEKTAGFASLTRAATQRHGRCTDQCSRT
jgi:hypothetical protein